MLHRCEHVNCERMIPTGSRYCVEHSSAYLYNPQHSVEDEVIPDFNLDSFLTDSSSPDSSPTDVTSGGDFEDFGGGDSGGGGAGGDF